MKLFPLFGIALFLTSLAAFGSNRPTPLPGNIELDGNGTGYGGGENPTLSNARRSLITAMTQLRDGFDLASLARYESCKNLGEPQLCNTLSGLSEAQRKFVADFVQKSARAILEMNIKSPATPLELKEEALGVKDKVGNPLPVAGKTKLGPEGPIFLNAENARLLSPLALVALITHEFGHKVKFSSAKSGFVDDVEDIGPFNGKVGGGRELLDAAGAAVAAYIADHVGKVPVLFPKDVSCSGLDLRLALEQAPFFGDSARETAGVNGVPGADDMRAFFQGRRDGDFTVSVWAKLDPESGSPSAKILVSNLDYEEKESHFGFEFARLKNGNLGGYAGASTVYDSGLPVAPGRFHHLAMTRINGTVQLYVDGLAGKKPGTSRGYLKSKTLPQIGRAGSPASARWTGNIGSVSFYEKGLSQKEIAKLSACAEF